LIELVVVVWLIGTLVLTQLDVVVKFIDIQKSTKTPRTSFQAD